MLKEKIKNYVVAATDVLLVNLSVLITLLVLALEQKNYAINIAPTLFGQNFDALWLKDERKDKYV